MAGKLQQTIDQYYSDLASGEATALKRIAVAHERTITELNKQLIKVTAIMEKDAKLGLDSGTYVLQQQRLSAFILESNNLYQQFGTQVGLAVSQAQQDAVALASQFVPNAIEGLNGPHPLGADFAQLSQTQLQQMVGALGDGSPLRTLTESFGNEASTFLNRELIQGIGAGLSPLEVARRMSNVAPSIGRARAETIARTEMLRTAREASRRTMLENKDVVKGWQWYCSRDTNTCPVCWAMHGKQFKLTTTMATHPNCRCAQLPVTYTWKELGFNVQEVQQDRSLTTSGESLFSRLDAADQKRILGKGGYTLWKAKLVTLDDFVQDTFSPAWGYGRSTRSLRSLVGQGHAASLTKGVIPPGLKPTQFRKALPNIGDPFVTARTRLQDLLDKEIIDQLDYDNLVTMIDNGAFADSGEAITALETTVNENYDLVLKQANEAFDLGAITEDELAEVSEQIFNQTITKEELSKTLDDIDLLITEKKGQLQAEYDSALNEYMSELKKGQAYGTVSKAEASQTITDLHLGNVKLTKSELDDALLQLKTKHNLVGNPYDEMLQTLEEAHTAGVIDQYEYQLFKEEADLFKIPADAIDGLKQHWDDLLTPKKVFTDPLGHPDFVKIQELFNNGKLSYGEYSQIWADIQKGAYTNEQFANFADSTYTALKNKVTKTSQQLFDELDNIVHMPSSAKQELKAKYKSKAINKEEMQQAIDDAAVQFANAPVQVATPTPGFTSVQEAWDAVYDAYWNKSSISYKDYSAAKKVYNNIGGYNPWGKFVSDDDFIKYAEKKLGIKGGAAPKKLGKLPYKKHVDDITKLVSDGKMPQSVADEIYQKYQIGAMKNKDIEQLIDYYKIQSQQQSLGGTIASKGLDPVTEWDKFDAYGWMNGRGNSWFHNVVEPRLSRESRTVIQDYTGSFYTPLNKYLRRGITDSYYDKTRLDQLTASMDEAFRSLGLPEDMTLLRTTSVTDGHVWTNPAIGDIWEDLGYMSTTVDRSPLGFGSSAKNASDRVFFEMRISAPKGTRGMWVRPISGVPGENEVILQRGTKFKVVKVENVHGVGKNYRVFLEVIEQAGI